MTRAPAPRLAGVESASGAEASGRANSRAAGIANCIQRDFLLLRLSPGDRLGSEHELCARFEVGRETLREAIAILEMRGIGCMQRGRRGGLVVRAPELTLVARSFSGHALLMGITVEHVAQAERVASGISARVTNVVMDMITNSLTTLQAHFTKGGALRALPADHRQRITIGSRRAGQIARNIVAQLAYAPVQGELRFGSERDLSLRFAVSKSIARQIVRLLQDMGVAQCRRGNGCGIFVTPPTPQRITDTMSLYLLTHAATPAAAWQTARSLRVECVKAASQLDSLTRERVCRDASAFLKNLSDDDHAYQLEDLFRVDQSLEGTACNPLLVTIFQGLKAYSALAQPHRDQILSRFLVKHGSEYFQLSREIIRRIAEGDPAAAGDSQELLNAFFTHNIRSITAA